ncbi:MAG: hypothetical protein ABSC95_31495 [Acetobacteraceae bacterium]
MAAKRFVWWWLTAVVGLLTLTALANFSVDPYGIYGWINIAGLNQDKTQAVDQSRMAKVYLVDHARPATLLIGSSRVEAGLDPESPAWPQDLRPVFNLGIPGSDPYTQLRYLQDALATTRPKLVVIGTDFIESLTSSANLAAASHIRGSLDFEERLRVTASGAPNGGLRLARARDIASTLLSLSALGDSISTLLSQRDVTSRKLTALGFNTAANYQGLVQTEGEYSLFVAKDREKIAEIIPLPKHPQLDVGPIGQSIAEALAHGSRVIVVITPGHADELEIYRQAGIMHLYDAWLRRLTETVAAAGDGKVELWNFAGLTPYTVEKIPNQGDTHTQLSWFWETNHFKPALGNLIISRILGQGPEGFGEQLTLTTLPRVQAELRAQQQQYVETHPAGVTRISQLLAERMDHVCQPDPALCPRTVADANQRSIDTQPHQDQ